MFKVAVLLTFAASALGALPLPDGRIVGGKEADIKDYPYQLSLLYKERHICGAAILNEIWVVTAAHCTNKFPASVLKVRAGSSKFSTGGQVIEVKKIYQNSNYNSNTIDYDISILELSEPITLGINSSVINPINEGATYHEGQPATVTGWGYTRESGSVSSNLQVITVPIVSSTKCNKAYDNKITERMLCAGYEKGGKDSCSGDSGGPLVVNGTLAGIVSWGYGCARAGYPGVYTSVANVRSFIKDITGI